MALKKREASLNIGWLSVEPTFRVLQMETDWPLRGTGTGSCTCVAEACLPQRNANRWSFKEKHHPISDSH